MQIVVSSTKPTLVRPILTICWVALACSSPTGSNPGDRVDGNATGGSTVTEASGGSTTAPIGIGGATAVNGGAASGGATSSGGVVETGGAFAAGGSPGAGGMSVSGGATATGGVLRNTGGVTASVGGVGGVGSTGSGGSPLTGGTTPTGGKSTATGGSFGIGGTQARGGSGIGGTSAQGGTSNTGGTSTEGACDDPTKVTWTGAPARPQLTDAVAPCFTIKRYLKDWDPTSGLPGASTLAATYTVAADGSGTHTTVQAAVKAATGPARTYILVKPGKYRETVCVQGTTPITLYGTDPDPASVAIAYDNVNGKAVSGSSVNECQPASGTFGTTTSSTFFVKSNDFQAMNLTIANDYAEPGNVTAQAVAMTTQGDRLVFQNVRFIGNQDTLQPGAASATAIARSYYRSCKVEGDTDFIFGNGTAVFDGCDITYIGTRKTGGSHMAPSTDKSNLYGFLFVASHFIAGEGSKAGAARLGRAWDVSNQPNSNGQAILRECQLDSHVSNTEPWGESTESRPFSADGNRFFEYRNTGPGAAK